MESKAASQAGWLKRKGNFLGIWRQCYCELVGNDLILKKTNTTHKIERMIHITPETRIDMVTNDKVPRMVIDDGTEPFLLASDDENTLLSWVLALRTATYQETNYSMDQFDIVSVIGRGFHGKVMLVRHKQTRDLFAMKTVHKARLMKSNKVHTVIRERNILAKARNPFIVQLCFAFQTDRKFYLGLEYVPGGELFRRMQNEDEIPVNEVKLYVAEVAIALDYLHSLGIVYRDLKPENVLITCDGHIKLTDFGLSKELSDEVTTTFCGTPEYVAPEVIKREPYSCAIDWWSLGVLCYELLYGTTPFTSSNRVKLFQMIMNSPPRFPEGADADAQDFIRKLLNKDPKQRAKFEDIKHHPFWGDMDLDAVARREVEATYKPKIEGQDDTKNFDEEFTQETATDSLATPTFGASNQFNGFSYAGMEVEPEQRDVGASILISGEVEDGGPM